MNDTSSEIPSVVVQQSGRKHSKGSAMPLLDQDKIWITREGAVVRLDSMDISHCKNLMRFLERNREALQTKWGLELCKSVPNGEMAQDAFDNMLEEEAEKDSLQWLQERPLYKRLAKLAYDGGQPIEF